MKKAYSMPTITVEELQLDKPIAVDCKADYDDMNSLIELGYFYDYCGELNVDLPGNKPPYGDTICYHSNVQTAFLS